MVAEGRLRTLPADLGMALVKALLSISLLVLRYSFHDAALALVILMQGCARLALL